MISYLDRLVKRRVEPDSLPRRFWLAALSSLLIYWFCLQFLFPGYFAPLSPFHIDIYDYVGTREKTFPDLLLKYPRPVAYFAMKTLAAGGVRGLLAGEIAITLVNVLFTALLAERTLRIRSRWLLSGIALYLLLLFAHPDFYFEHRHDLPADVAYLFLVFGLLAFVNGTKAGMAAAAVCIVLSAFAKETYFVSAPLLILGMAVASRGRRLRHFAFLAFVVIVEIASVSYTSHINSPFVNANADVHATYHINVEPAVVAQTYWFYVAHLVNAALVVIAAAGLIATWRDRRRFLMLAAFVAAGLAVFATHAVLPNHLFEEYAWAGAPLFLIPVLMLCEAGPAWRMGAGVLGVAAVFGYSMNYNTEMLKYMVEEDLKGRALMPSLAELARLPRPARILVAGIEDPVIPWEVPDFVRSEFGGQLHWSVLLPSEVQFRRNSPLARFIGPADVQWSQYDYLASYDSDGHMLSVRSVHRIPEAEQRDMTPLLVPSLGLLLEQARREPRNYGLFLRCADASLRWGFWQEARICLDRARDAGGGADATFTRLTSELAARQAEASVATRAAVPELPELTARPQRITKVNAKGLGVTELFWRVPAGTAFEIHVGAPDGPLFAKGQQSGHQVTQEWVKDGTEFFLQDVTEGEPLTLKNTMAKVAVSVVQ